MLNLPKYTIGVGDRFGRQGKAQLQAMIEASAGGIDIAPVWNKSHREHTIIQTTPESVRAEADAAVAALGWTGPYFVDADHVGLDTVEAFAAASDFFTLDVADATGTAAPASDIRAFVDANRRFVGALEIPGIDSPLSITEDTLTRAAETYLLAIREAGLIYRRVLDLKGTTPFVTEVSMDETDAPQGPEELLFILSAIAAEGIPAQTVAPKFSGRFNKGVDYVGDVERFAREFDRDLAVIAFATDTFDLPANLKLSVHSGSDKFGIYRAMGDAIRRFDAGLHLKTAGTTWLEELVGLALSGEEGLNIATTVYKTAYDRLDELCGPYATVIDIDTTQLPEPSEVASWDGERFAAALRHNPREPCYNPHLRQLIHVGYKVAAEMGPMYLDALARHEASIAPHVTENILDRHIRRIFA